MGERVIERVHGRVREYVSEQVRRYRGSMECGTPLASEAVSKFLKHRLLSANLGVPMVSKSVNTHAYFVYNSSTSIVNDISQHRIYRIFILKRKRCQQGLLNQGL